LKKVIDSKPDVINHNIEVVQDLFPDIRPEGNYFTSLEVLKNIKKINRDAKTKSGFMIGIGENKNQILKTMKDLRDADVDFLTIGQYLQPTRDHAGIEKYYTPQEFEEFKKIALDMGFKHVESGPLVRSSYHAERAIS
jgi:lipoic acid synthetase